MKSVENTNMIKGRVALASFGGVNRFATAAAPTAMFSGAPTPNPIKLWSAATANTPQLMEPQIISQESVQIIDEYEQLV